MTEEEKAAAGTPPDDQGATTTGASPGTTPATTQSQDDSKPEISTLPKYWQDHIKDLRAENKAKREAAQTAEDERKAKEQADLEAKQEWEKLAKAREQEVSALKPKADEAAELSELLTAQINKEIEKWPEEVKATAPDGTVSALEMVKWLDKTRPLAEKLLSLSNAESTTTQARTPPPGNTPGPTPSATSGGGQVPTGANREPAVVDVERRF